MTSLIERFSRKQEPQFVVNYAVVTPIRAESGDTLIIQCPKRISRDVFLKLKAQLQERFGPEVGVIVLEAGLSVQGVIEGRDR